MDFIQKPFQEDQLVALVERMLDQPKTPLPSTRVLPAGVRSWPD